MENYLNILVPIINIELPEADKIKYNKMMDNFYKVYDKYMNANDKFLEANARYDEAENIMSVIEGVKYWKAKIKFNRINRVFNREYNKLLDVNIELSTRERTFDEMIDYYN